MGHNRESWRHFWQNYGIYFKTYFQTQKFGARGASGVNVQLRAAMECKCALGSVCRQTRRTVTPPMPSNNKTATPSPANSQCHSGHSGAPGHTAGNFLLYFDYEIWYKYYHKFGLKISTGVIFCDLFWFLPEMPKKRKKHPFGSGSSQPDPCELNNFSPVKILRFLMQNR